jgi:ketosteroid isomerase-like protein
VSSTDGHPNAALGHRLFEALAAGDAEAIRATMTEDVVWHAPGTSRFSGRFDGRTAVMDRLARMRDAGLTTGLDVHDVVANDEHIVALVHLHLANDGGDRYDQPQVQVMHVRDDRIAELWSMNQDQAVLDLLMGS